MSNRVIITIGRQYGSGGRYVGRLVAEKLGIPFYDKELVDMASQESGINKDLFVHADEKASKPFWSIFPSGSSSLGHSAGTDLPMNDKLFLIQCDIVRKIAEQGSCVIVGRCADYVLKDDPDLIRVFIHASMDYKKEHVIQYYGVPEKDAETIVNKKDKSRSNYYNYYTGLKWGVAEQYDLCINTALLRADQTSDVIVSFAKIKMDTDK